MQRDLQEEIEGKETGNIVQSRDVGIPILGDPQDGVICSVEGDGVSPGYRDEGGDPWKEKDGRELPVNNGTRSGEKRDEGPVDLEVGEWVPAADMTGWDLQGEDKGATAKPFPMGKKEWEWKQERGPGEPRFQEKEDHQRKEERTQLEGDLDEPEENDSYRTGPNRTEPDQTGPNRTEPDRTGRGISRLGSGQYQVNPNRTGPNRSEPDRTGPNRTEPDRTQPNRTGRKGEINSEPRVGTCGLDERSTPNRTEPDRTGPNRTGPNRTEPEEEYPDWRSGQYQFNPNRTGPDRTGPNRTEPDRTGPDQTEPNWKKRRDQL